MIACKNCNTGLPLDERPFLLERINPKGVTAEWLCSNCFQLVEFFDGHAFYVHAANCQGGCDYDCNRKTGFDLAEQINVHMDPRVLSALKQEVKR